MNNSFFKINAKKICSDTGKKIYDKNFPLFQSSIELLENNFQYNLKSSFLYNYLNDFNPKNYSEVFGLKDTSKILSSLSKHSNFYPWMHSLPKRHLYPGLFGIKEDVFVEFILCRLINIIKSIKKNSFVPNKFDSIMGYLMIKHNDYRFVITSGTHRTSAILALSNKKLLDIDNLFVKFDNIRISNSFHTIYYNKIDLWPAVKKGYISKIEAKKQFNSYFL